jgi:hypothetical protein
MLSTSSVPFVQLQKISERDRFEASLSKSQREFSERIDSDDAFALEQFEQILSAEVADVKMSKEEKLNYCRKTLGSWLPQAIRAFNFRSFFISCWYSGNHEPAGMWSAYASESDGVVMRTTSDSMTRAFANSQKDIYWGKVAYSDYAAPEFSVPTGNAFFPVYSKRIEYAQENELRLSYLDKDAAIDNADASRVSAVVNVDCDLNVLIQEVRIAPFSGGWLLDAVRSLFEKYEVSAEVRRSSLVDM